MRAAACCLEGPGKGTRGIGKEVTKREHEVKVATKTGHLEGVCRTCWALSRATLPGYQRGNQILRAHTLVPGESNLKILLPQNREAPPAYVSSLPP